MTLFSYMFFYEIIFSFDLSFSFSYLQIDWSAFSPELGAQHFMRNAYSYICTDAARAVPQRIQSLPLVRCRPLVVPEPGFVFIAGGSKKKPAPNTKTSAREGASWHESWNILCLHRKMKPVTIFIYWIINIHMVDLNNMLKNWQGLYNNPQQCDQVGGGEEKTRAGSTMGMSFWRKNWGATFCWETKREPTDQRKMSL